MKMGLTLMEILVVVAVIAILATMLIGVATRIDTQSKERAIEGTFALLEGALQEYREFKGTFPVATDADPNKNSQLLYAELNSVAGARVILEKINASLIKNKFGAADTPPEIYDLWGTVVDYRYVPGDSFTLLVSAGPDRKFLTPDDIKNR